MANVEGPKEYMDMVKRIRNDALLGVLEVNRKKAVETKAESDKAIPVETGALRNSGKVTNTKTGANINYGGKLAPYAVFVHNFPQLHHDVGGPFFLLNAMTKAKKPTNWEWAEAYKAAIAARKLANA